MNTDLFDSADDATELGDEERLKLIPSISTRAELNEIERLNINHARIWALRKSTMRRTDLLTRMHQEILGVMHPLLSLAEREKATSSRLAPTESARSPDYIGARVHPSHLWSVMNAG